MKSHRPAKRGARCTGQYVRAREWTGRCVRARRGKGRGGGAPLRRRRAVAGDAVAVDTDLRAPAVAAGALPGNKKWPSWLPPPKRREPGGPSHAAHGSRKSRGRVGRARGRGGEVWGGVGMRDRTPFVMRITGIFGSQLLPRASTSSVTPARGCAGSGTRDTPEWEVRACCGAHPRVVGAGDEVGHIGRGPLEGGSSMPIEGLC